MERPTLQETYGLYIDGEFRPASDGGTFETTCPATGEHLAICAEATADDVDAAVKGAWKAYESWKKTTTKERAAILNKLADVIDENKEFLAAVESMDNGKPIRETLYVDIPLAADHFRYFASVIEADEGSATIIDNRYMSLILREPIGVVGQIVPWNFPFTMAAWKLAPVLAAGDCTVFKPSSSTPLSVLEFAKMTADIIPAGVFQVVTGSGRKSGQALLDHPDLRKLAFTGSTEVGYNVAEAAAKKLIPATLELGGKSANIFFDDCDFEKAMDGLQMGILFNQGQVCCAGSRVFVQDTIYDKFLDEAVKRFNAVKLGDPLDETTQMGSQINEKQVKKILSYIDIAKQEGARIACGGERATEGDLAKGAYVKPTLIVDAKNSMRVCQEEIFGPVAVVLKFHSEEEVLQMANDSEYGLGGAVWTQDINRAFRVARGVETGRMWVNTYNQLPEKAPFGGYKKSGIGRETHKSILNAYTQTKNIFIDMENAPSGFYPAK
ncbi:MAG: aldehyde dehydrogenase family protein [Coriobacteriales bacterium]|jgi:aldehyde dehydrogenase (NAD+)